MLYREIRPKELGQVLGNQEIVANLTSCLENPKHPHAYLFVGPRGCGKTTLARIMAAGFGCRSMDIMELNTADFRGIDASRSLIEEAQYAPLGGGDKKAFILDECHQLTGPAMEALLKITEDTPEFVYFFFCTTMPEKLLETLVNRCTVFHVKPLRDPEMKQLLIRGSSHLKFGLRKSVCSKIIAASEGCPRRALVVLEQLSLLPDGADLAEVLRGAEIEEKGVRDICRLLCSGKQDRFSVWKEIASIYKGLPKSEYESHRRQILGYFRACILSEEHNGQKVLFYREIARSFEGNYFNVGEAGLLLSLHDACFVVDLLLDETRMETTE